MARRRPLRRSRGQPTPNWRTPTLRTTATRSRSLATRSSHAPGARRMSVAEQVARHGPVDRDRGLATRSRDTRRTPSSTRSRTSRTRAVEFRPRRRARSAPSTRRTRWRTPGVLAVLTHENAPELARRRKASSAFSSHPGSRTAARSSARRSRRASRQPARPRDSSESTTTRKSTTSSCAATTRGSTSRTRSTRPTSDRHGGRRRGAGPRTAAITIDATYSTPAEHNNPMEPHATTAVWDGDALTLYDSDPGSPTPYARTSRAACSGLEPEQVRVIAPHVGGGFGIEGPAAPPRDRRPALAARHRRPAGASWP